MTLEELEVKLTQASITPPVAKLIATMALDPGVERHENSWAVPVGLLIDPKAIRRDRQGQQLRESLLEIMQASLETQWMGMGGRFKIVTELTIARGNAYLSYRFSSPFIQWAGLTQIVPAKLQ